MKKKYIIVGDNNFWYSTTDKITESELIAEMKSIHLQILDGQYLEVTPTTLFAYEAKEVLTLIL